jgi:excisionase family DNA binding protein
MTTINPPGGRLLTPGEVAALFRVDAKTVTRWAAAGRIDSIRTPGGHRRFREDEVRALLGVDAPADETEWLIWSNEHDAWWGPDERGYYRDVHRAGCYAEAHARRIARVRGWRDDRTPPEVAIPCLSLGDMASADRDDLLAARVRTYARIAVAEHREAKAATR